MPSLSVFLAQVTNAANAAVAGAPDNTVAGQPDRPFWFYLAMYALLFALVYLLFFRPQTLAKKQQEEKIRAAKTGDKIVTSSGIHGVITNVKDSTVIVRVADSVKLEIEKSHIDKIVRPESSDSDKSSSKAS